MLCFNTLIRIFVLSSERFCVVGGDIKLWNNTSCHPICKFNMTLTFLQFGRKTSCLNIIFEQYNFELQYCAFQLLCLCSTWYNRKTLYWFQMSVISILFMIYQWLVLWLKCLWCVIDSDIQKYSFAGALSLKLDIRMCNLQGMYLLNKKI